MLHVWELAEVIGHAAAHSASSMPASCGIGAAGRENTYRVKVSSPCCAATVRKACCCARGVLLLCSHCVTPFSESATGCLGAASVRSKETQFLAVAFMLPISSRRRFRQSHLQDPERAGTCGKSSVSSGADARALQPVALAWQACLLRCREKRGSGLVRDLQMRKQTRTSAGADALPTGPPLLLLRRRYEHAHRRASC